VLIAPGFRPDQGRSVDSQAQDLRARVSVVLGLQPRVSQQHRAESGLNSPDYEIADGRQTPSTGSPHGPE